MGAALVVADPEQKRRLGWAVQSCMEKLLIDGQGRNRDYLGHSFTCHRALGFEMWDGAPSAPHPLPHIPLEVDDAKTLIGPLSCALRSAT